MKDSLLRVSFYNHTSNIFYFDKERRQKDLRPEWASFTVVRDTVTINDGDTRSSAPPKDGRRVYWTMVREAIKVKSQWVKIFVDKGRTRS